MNRYSAFDGCNYKGTELRPAKTNAFDIFNNRCSFPESHSNSQIRGAKQWAGTLLENRRWLYGESNTLPVQGSGMKTQFLVTYVNNHVLKLRKTKWIKVYSPSCLFFLVLFSSMVAKIFYFNGCMCFKTHNYFTDKPYIIKKFKWESWLKFLKASVY